jgi:Domain of unknown function (DUF1905)/Bacteriocin-protection, YdeI or OmpD-Associated
MLSFITTIKKFTNQGEKTGWTYIDVPEKIALQLKPGNKKSFRVKGKLDDFSIMGIALVPMGGGDFIMALNAAVRKGIGKRNGDKVKVQIAVDEKGYELPNDFIDCLKDEPAAYIFFNTLTQGHRNYFGKWIDSAKGEATKTKRIAVAVNALAKQMGYPEMIRAAKKEKDTLTGF